MSEQRWHVVRHDQGWIICDSGYDLLDVVADEDIDHERIVYAGPL